MPLKILILSFILISSCIPKKKFLESEFSNIVYNCPNNGNCDLEILENKSLLLNHDLGKLNYKLIDNKNKTVVRYQYSKDLDKSVVDGGYREEIIFEINSKNTDNKIFDVDLQKTKMLFGRFCFCRGQTGFYKIINGNLKIKKGKKLNFKLNFKINEVPQIVNEIIVVNDKL
ncbi:MAG: hypothetical protein H7174_05860 [Flavobacterium sp.]|nr:hypothetical protein [Flavobacterium sp.]